MLVSHAIDGDGGIVGIVLFNVPNGILREAGFQRGDVLTSIAGVSVEEPAMIPTMNRILLSKQPVVVCGRRRGVPFAIEMTLRGDLPSDGGG